MNNEQFARMSVHAERIPPVGRLKRWLLNDRSLYANLSAEESNQIEPLRLGLFLALHLGIAGILYTGTSLVALVVCVALYLLRMLFITAFYHRYFSHRIYKVSRRMQFLFAVAGCTAGQRGPVWWASHHRHHHLNSDQAEDPHSPNKGMLESHMLWFLKKGHFAARSDKVNDLLRYPELRLVEALHWLPFLLLAIACYYGGMLVDNLYPALETSGAQMLVWGFFISTILLYHGTYTINSLAHRFGSRRYNTADDSRNNALLALLTLGEGWHNNHHRYPASTRQGFFWWEIDISYLILRLMAMLGLVSDMRPVPVSVMQESRAKSA